MRTKIEVLDYGYVALVDCMGNDKSIVSSARVSYRGIQHNWKLEDKDKKLISSLIKRGHTSPFECVTFTFAVKAPIFVFRQWHRHRTWSFNEVSARYKVLSDEYYVPEPEHVGHQMQHEKQMRDTARLNGNAVWAVEKMQESAENAFALYRQLIQHNVPRELARSVLPVSTYSEMYATVNLHNLVHFLRLRCDEHAQYEIRVYADAMLELAKIAVPYAMSEFEKIIKGKSNEQE